MQNMARDVDRAATQQEKTELLMQLQGLNPDGTDNPDLEDWLDLENMSDYLIVNYYGHNSDWPFKNYYVGRENSPESEGFQFFMWDAEWSLFLRSSVTGDNINRREGVAIPFQFLRSSDEFRQVFGDRVHRALFNGGPLYVDPDNPNWDPEHPERNMPAKQYSEWTEQIYDALIAESARWGDQHRSRPYTRDVEWQREFDRIMGQWFPRRSAILLDLFRAKGLYPDVEAVQWNQRGGMVAGGSAVELTAPKGTIYYTFDGSDPRQIGGSISASAIQYTGPITLTEDQTIRARVRDGNQWSAIDEASFLVDVVAASSDSLRVAELQYHPAEPTPAEIAAGHGDADDFEFIELVNISDATVDLTDVRFVRVPIDGNEEGVNFDFAQSEVTRLRPGQRVVIVEDIGAFTTRYGANRLVAGQWTGQLSNGGETLTVMAGDQILQQFRYSDQWYPSTDGLGPSLEVVDESADDLQQWNRSEGWRPSNAPGGTPAAPPAEMPLVGDVNADGIFNSSDLLLLFQRGEYEDAIANNSTFADGDFNGDGDFDSSDLLFAFQAGTYLAAAMAPATVFVDDGTRTLLQIESSTSDSQSRHPVDRAIALLALDEFEL